MASVAVSFREGPCPLSSCLGEAQSPAPPADPKGQIQDPPSLLQLWPTFRRTALRMGITDLESWPGVEPTLSSPMCSWGLQSSPGQRVSVDAISGWSGLQGLRSMASGGAGRMCFQVVTRWPPDTRQALTPRVDGLLGHIPTGFMENLC